MKKFKLFAALFMSIIMFGAYSQIKVTRGEWKATGENRNLYPCPANSLFSQEPTDYNTWDASWASDLGANCLCQEDFSGITEPIGVVHFYGMMLTEMGVNSEAENPMTFEIKFYNDNAGSPGSVIYSETMNVTAENTGDFFFSYKLYHFKATLSSTVNVSHGWISIQGIIIGSPTDVWFFWQDSVEGNNIAWDNGYRYYANFAFCLAPAENNPEVPLASWPIAIAIGLIALAVAFRFHRSYN